MKINKRSLLNSMTPIFESLGYQLMKTKDNISPCIFFKIIERRFVLMTGFTLSNFYQGRYTIDFYISPTFSFALSLPDLPHSNYNRIASFLTNNEKENLVSPDFRGENIKDAWWDTLDSKTIERVREILILTEPRFLNQEGLFNGIESSKRMEERLSTINKVITEAEKAKISLDVKDELFCEIVRVKLIEYLGNPSLPKFIINFGNEVINYNKYIVNQQ